MTNKMFGKEEKESTGVRKWLDDRDSEGWAAFAVFFAVITLGMYMNFVAFRGVIGDIPALMISLLFESSILAWKITSNRRRNDARQNRYTNWATWLSVLLAVGMLVVNMFRVGGETNFEYTAYIIVGVAALVQVLFYLFFSQADQDRQLIREHNQMGRELTRKQVKARNVIGELETDVQIIRYIVQELQRIDTESSDLPLAQREYLLEAARQKLLAQYAGGKTDVSRATAGLADLNKDGFISMEPAKKPVFLDPPAQVEALPTQELPTEIEEPPTESDF